MSKRELRKIAREIREIKSELNKTSRAKIKARDEIERHLKWALKQLKGNPIVLLEEYEMAGSSPKIGLKVVLEKGSVDNYPYADQWDAFLNQMEKAFEGATGYAEVDDVSFNGETIFFDLGHDADADDGWDDGW